MSDVVAAIVWNPWASQAWCRARIDGGKCPLIGPLIPMSLVRGSITDWYIVGHLHDSVKVPS